MSIWYQRVFPFEIILRMIILFHAHFTYLLLIYMVFDIFFIFFKNFKAKDNTAPLFLSMEVISIYIYQFISGPNIPTFYLTKLYIFMAVSNEKIYYCYFLILNTSISSFYIGKFNINETLLLVAVLLLETMFLESTQKMMKVLNEEKIKSEKEHEKERLKGKFITIASHELRNPIQSVSFLITYLESFDCSNKQKEIIGEIKGTIDYLISIIDNILDFSKIDSKKMKLNKKIFSISDILERMGTIFHPKSEEKGLIFNIDLDPKIPSSLKGDSTKVTQIVTNFVSNAIKYTEKGSILLSANLLRTDEDICRIEIDCIDTGVGIKDQEKPFIFQPFQQIGDIENKGWGLGLSITREIVQLMKGDIGFESNKNGTKFWTILDFEISNHTTIKNQLAKLPIYNITLVHPDESTYRIIEKCLNVMGIRTHRTFKNFQKEESILLIHESIYMNYLEKEKFEKIFLIGNQPTSLNEPVTLKKLNRFLLDQTPLEVQKTFTSSCEIMNLSILLVEDNLMINHLEKKLLHQSGINNVISVYNGQEALKLVEECKKPFDLILMDIYMPKLNGIEATKAIRNMKDPQKSSIPIIIITGNSLNPYEIDTIGANAYISKPVDFKELIKLIKKVTNI